VPRYLVVRTFDLDEEAMPEVGRRSQEIADQEFPEMTWEHTHVVIDEDSTVRQFCVYRAPDEETIRAHGKRVGSHRIDDIWEIAGDVTPADFPSTR
jgi:hypothetical protein